MARHFAGRHALIRLVLAAGACALLGHAAPASAEEATLNVKPGLWEMTTSSLMEGEMPIPDEALAKMTPEQRSKMEAMLSAMKSRAKAPHVFRECLTEKQIREGLQMRDRDDPACHRTVTSTSGTRLEVREECSGAHARSVTAKFEASDPGTLHGHVVAEITHGMHTMTVTSEIAGKRLGSDCGGLAPGQMQRE